MHELSRQARFAAEYVVDHNATQAGIRAGYAPKWAGVNCAPLVHRPAFRLAIAQREASLMARVALTPEDVLREVARVAFADLGRLYAPDGRLLPVPAMDDDTLAAVASLSVRRSPDGRRRVKVRALDKMRALEMLGRHFRRIGDTVAGAVVDEALDRAVDAALRRAP